METQHFRKSRSWFRFKFDWFLWLFAALFAFLFISLQMSAQGGQAHAKAADQGALVQDSKFADKSSQNEQAEEPQNPKNRKRRIPEGIIFAPIPISSPAIGSGVVLAGGYIFPFRKADRVSPPSTVAGAAVITDNGTRGLVLAGEFYLKENSYHITTAYFHGNINYNFYGVGVDAGSSSEKLPLTQTGQAFLGEFLYRLKGKLFLGPRILSGSSTITLRSETEGKVQPPPDAGIETQLTGIGFRLNRDSRLNRFYPTQGTFLDFTSIYFSEDLGSKYSFQSHRFGFNGYQGLTGKQVLAYNIYACVSGGKPPFYGECIYGANNELRGYVGGQHIDKYMIATQGEYRLALPWRLGMVAFAGLGEVAPTIGQFSYDNLLPAFGGGLRLKLSKKYGVNLRADIAQGRDGHTFSMGIGEAF